MATELVIKSWCDVCLEGGDNTPGETLTIAAGAVPAFDIELCPRHAKPLAEAVAALAPFGRGVGKGVPRVPNAQRARGDQSPNAQACPVCTNPFRTTAALRSHLRREHGQSLADVGIEPATHHCPECGSAFGNGQGLASHVRRTHPEAWRAQRSA
jgi:uncharacterized C2H2 Zn-finger protein